MANFLNRVKDYLFADEANEDDYNAMGELEDEIDVPKFEEEHYHTNSENRRSKVVSMNAANNLSAVQGGTMKMILFQPLAYEDSQAIVDNLRARKPVIVNMVDLERDCAQRVIDFISGAAYALGGTIRKVSFGIFVIVPSNVSIVGNSEE